MSCLLRAAGCCRYANGMLSLVLGILRNIILHWICAWASVRIAECWEPLDFDRGRSLGVNCDFQEKNRALDGFWMPVFLK